MDSQLSQLTKNSSVALASLVRKFENQFLDLLGGAWPAILLLARRLLDCGFSDPTADGAGMHGGGQFVQRRTQLVSKTDQPRILSLG